MTGIERMQEIAAVLEAAGREDLAAWMRTGLRRFLAGRADAGEAFDLPAGRARQLYFLRRAWELAPDLPPHPRAAFLADQAEAMRTICRRYGPTDHAPAELTPLQAQLWLAERAAPIGCARTIYRAFTDKTTASLSVTVPPPGATLTKPNHRHQECPHEIAR